MADSTSMLQLDAVSALGTGGGDAPAVAFDHHELRILEEPFLAVWSVRRSRIAQPAFSGLKLGFNLPEAANRFTGDAQTSCAWIEPHAWLLLGVDAMPEAPQHFLIADVSDRSAVFRLSGPRAAELLAAACPAALPSVLGAGRCARTKFAEEADVFIQQLAPQEFRLLIDVGLARFAARWLRESSTLLLRLGVVA
jgi:heterotetrameric sarcosine oxidase gamma subunit